MRKKSKMKQTKTMPGLLCSMVLLLLSGFTSYGQNATLLRGTVLNETESPMPGVTISVRSTTQENVVFNAITDMSGTFEVSNITASGLYNITASALDYAVAEIPAFEIVSGQTNSLLIRMQPADTSDLQDVIVVGYGTQRRENLTGAVAQISADDIRDRPVTNMSGMLQGVIPNLTIRMGGGAPGTMGSINVRGVTSVNAANNSVQAQGPLVIIDGIPGTLDRLSPEEVETITVLKDAASAAIYGARGPFGVILITTKMGKSGITNIRYNNSFGFNTPTVSTDFMTSGYDWMKLNDAALAHVGGYSGYTEQDYAELYARRNDKTEDPSRPWATIQNRNGRDQYVYYGNYDWWNIMFTKWQPNQNHNLNITGGNDKIRYMVNGNMKTMDGILRTNTDKYNSYTLRSRVSADINSWLKFSQNVNFYHSAYNYFGRQGGANANFSSINVHASPAYAPFNPDGTPFYITGLNRYDIADGAFLLISDGNNKGAERKYEMTTLSEVTISPIKNLNIIGNYSYRMFTDPSYYRITPATYSLYPGVIDTSTRYRTDVLSEDQQFNQLHVINVYGDYTKSFSDHTLKLMAGYNQEYYHNKKITGTIQDLATPELNDFNLGTGLTTLRGGSSELFIRGYFYRLNYDYKNKYLLETNGRLDGSSRFSGDKNYGFFPSVSAGWVVSREKFFEPLKNTVSFFKLRGSIGSLGNQEVAAGGFYPYVNTITSGTMAYILDGERARYYRYPDPVSATITWERVTSYNFGADLGFFNNRLNLNYDYFIRNTIGFLARGLDLPDVFGAQEPNMNVGSLRTKGFELTVNWKDAFNIGAKPFNYNLGFVLGDNYSYVTDLIDDYNLTYQFYKGKRIGEIWGYITDGYFKTDAEAKTYPVNQEFLNRGRRDNNISIKAGDLRWVDLNGDNIISSGENTIENPGDHRIIGNTTPRYTYSFTGSARWNGFDVNIFFQGLGKMDWYPGNNADRFWGPYSRPYFTFIPKDFEKDVWSPENPNAYFPTLFAYVALNGNNELRATNNKYLQDLAYLRLKNLTVGYSFPTEWMSRIKVKNFRVFVSGENLFTWTKLRSKYIDPEQAMADSNGRVYPFSKVYSFGVDITL